MYVVTFPQDTEAAVTALTEAQQQLIQRQRNLDMLQRFTSGWLRLQNEVNALIDSTSAENTDQNVSLNGPVDGHKDQGLGQPFVGLDEGFGVK